KAPAEVRPPPAKGAATVVAAKADLAPVTKPAKPADPAPSSAAPPPAVVVAANAPSPSPLAPIKADSAGGFVTQFLDDAFRIARAPDTTPLQRRAQLAQLSAGNMDIADIAVYTTGEKLPAQPAEFQQRFRAILIGYLVETYYPKIEAASDRSVSVTVTAA